MSDIELPVARGAILGALAVLSGCGIPADPMNTFERVQGGVVRVGAAEAPPWIVANGEEAVGPEADLVREFARSIGAEVAWTWAPVDELMESLGRFELDAAGLTRGSPWRRHVALTRPYRIRYDTLVSVADSGARVVRRAHVLAVPPGENRSLMALEGALPRAGR